MDPNECKQQFSFAYVRAVGATAGYAVYRPDVDEDSVDLVTAARGKMGTLRSPRLEMQVKCTARHAVQADGIHFPLKLKNYNELRMDDYPVPRVLCVVVVPERLEDWLRHSEEEMAMRHCGYWASLRGLPDAGNDTSQTVLLLRDQQLTVSALKSMMARIGSGGLP